MLLSCNAKQGKGYQFRWVTPPLLLIGVSLHIIQPPCLCCGARDLLCCYQLVPDVVGRGLVELEQVCSTEQQQLVVCICCWRVMGQLQGLRGGGGKDRRGSNDKDGTATWVTEGAADDNGGTGRGQVSRTGACVL